MLAMHPEYQQQVFDEVRAIFPDQQSDVTAEQLAQLEFTNRFIKESMRLNPTVPFVARTAKQEFQMSKIRCELFGGISIITLASNRWRDHSAGHRTDVVHLFAASPQGRVGSAGGHIRSGQLSAGEPGRKASVRLHTVQCGTAQLYRPEVRTNRGAYVRLLAGAQLSIHNVATNGRFAISHERHAETGQRSHGAGASTAVVLNGGEIIRCDLYYLDVFLSSGLGLFRYTTFVTRGFLLKQ